MEKDPIVEYLHKTIPKKVLKELFIREYGEEYLPENLSRLDSTYGLPILGSLQEVANSLDIIHRRRKRITFVSEMENKMLHTYKGGIASRYKVVERDVVVFDVGETRITLPLEFMVSDTMRMLSNYGHSEAWKYKDLQYMRDGFSIYEFFVKEAVESGLVGSVTCDPDTHWFNVEKSKFIYGTKEISND